MPLYIPWLTETIKKRGVRYLLHHYLGQFFLEKLTLEQLSIDIYGGKGSIRNLALDVDGLNDELDFIPFKFLDGCLIEEISVEVPWSSLATDACRVELDGAKFICRLKTSSDGTKATTLAQNSNNESSTLLSRSLMTSSMQMAEDIVTREDNDEYDYYSPDSSVYKSTINHQSSQEQEHESQHLQPQHPADAITSQSTDANQMFEGLEMFAQLIDSVLRRTKLTARNTLFQIQPHVSASKPSDSDSGTSGGSDEDCEGDTTLTSNKLSSESGEEFSEPLAKSDADDSDYQVHNEKERNRADSSSEGTVEFFIKFFRCEEIITDEHQISNEKETTTVNDRDNSIKTGLSKMPETVTKLLTLEDVEMRIGGIPVSNLIGKHTIKIKFNGHKSEISIFSGSPLLAVINHEQLKTFFNVFDTTRLNNDSDNLNAEKNQKLMSPEDYAKIEDQLLESAKTITTSKTVHQLNELASGFVSNNSIRSNHMSSNYQPASGRRWVESEGNEMFLTKNDKLLNQDYHDYHVPKSSISGNFERKMSLGLGTAGDTIRELEQPTLENIEAFSCELKLPGIWLCVLKHGERLPPLIKPYADSINSFETIHSYIEKHIKVPHIRMLALKVALDITSGVINIFLGDLDISEYSQDSNSMNPTLRLLHNDQTNLPMNSSRYKASVTNNRDIVIELLAKTRIILDPTLIDRIVYDYRLVDLNESSHEGKTGKSELKQPCNKKRNNQIDLNLTIVAEQFIAELLCPIPDLTPEAHLKETQLRPQSFLFDFKHINITWQDDKLNLVSEELSAFVKTQPRQGDLEAIKFIESTAKNKSDKIRLILEPSPSNLDDEFPTDVELALNESSMFDSIYVGQSSESKLPKEAFQTKRKVVRASFKQDDGETINDCDNEKILTPGDRQHLTEYLNQTVMSTKLSLSLHLPICEVEFEDKEQLDLIYNRFGNDFVFWRPKTFTTENAQLHKGNHLKKRNKSQSFSSYQYFKKANSSATGDESESDDEECVRQEDEDAFHSLSLDGLCSEFYENEITCKITVDELFVRFNHQSCASALKQEISADNLLLGVIIDVNKKPCTILSMVADNLELCTDSDIVLEGNSFGEKNSIFSMTADIKRPMKALKDIKLAIQLVNGLFNDFKTETFTRFWQSINVTDEPIMGYIAPKIVTELHIDILNTALSVVRDGARPALLCIDELYLTSMVMQQTSQVMIRLIADEVSLYLKKNRQSFEVLKNYVCLIDSGLIDLNVKISDDGRLEFNVMNNVITVRACQDSLSSLIRLINIMIKNSKTVENKQTNTSSNDSKQDSDSIMTSTTISNRNFDEHEDRNFSSSNDGHDDDDDDLFSQDEDSYKLPQANFYDEVKENGTRLDTGITRERNLLEDAMNDFSEDDTKNKSKLQETSISRQVLKPGRGSDDEYGMESPPMQSTPQRSKFLGTCPLDESNPDLGDFYPAPLLPTLNENRLMDEKNSVNSSRDEDSSDEDNSYNSTSNRPIDESGFFVIGNDDVGAGIIDKTQQEPIIRVLIDEPINIIDNYFKMTRPRTIPEMLASSLQRYVLEEMTLVVNLYGGKDLDDNDEDFEEAESKTEAGSQEHSAEFDTTSIDSLSIQSRANSSSAGSNSVKNAQRKHCSSDSTSSNSMGNRNKINTTIGKTNSKNRKKHLSEGSRDLYPTNNIEPRVRFGEGAVNLWESLDLMSSPDFLRKPSGAASVGNKRPNQQLMSSEIKSSGGTWRENDVCIQLTLTKVKLLYELSDGSTATTTTNAGASVAGADDDSIQSSISWRFMLFIHDIEIKDRIHASDINKMLYEYCTESMPKRNTQMLTIKNIATINPSDGCEECDLKVSLKPLRLNIDQDTLLFLVEFFTCLSKSLKKQQQFSSATPQANNKKVVVDATKSAAGLAKQQEPTTRADVGVVNRRRQPSSSNEESGGGEIGRQQRGLSGADSFATGGGGNHQPIRHRGSSSSSTTSSSCSSISNQKTPPNSLSRKQSSSQQQGKQRGSVDSGHATTTTTTSLPTGRSGEELPTHCHHSLDGDEAPGLAPGSQQPIYIKSFTFSPDVPIRLDYHAKHLNFEQGALAGILMGLAHLDHSELILRRVQAKHGMRGIDRVLVFTLNSWLTDIKRNQLPSILSGVGPMHSVIQLLQGMKDLFWMPIEHYRKDRRLVRGIQRGASSFSSSTAMAAINLMNRFISIVQCTAQIAHDIVTPPNVYSSTTHHRRLLLTSSGEDGQSSYKTTSGRRGSAHHSAATGSVSGSRHRHLASGGQSIGATSTISALNQPRNFCEGVAVGFTILKEGFNDTARNVAVGMQAEDVRSAVGELVRQIPSTLLNPIISATEGAQNVLVGIRNQIAPDARREDQEKWKRRVRGK